MNIICILLTPNNCFILKMCFVLGSDNSLAPNRPLTHWGRVTHICVSKLAIIASDNALSPGRRQAIIWNIAGILSIELLETNFSEILIEILTFSFKKMRLKVSSAKWRPFCLGLNVLTESHDGLVYWCIYASFDLISLNVGNIDAITAHFWFNTEWQMGM